MQLRLRVTLPLALHCPDCSQFPRQRQGLTEFLARSLSENGLYLSASTIAFTDFGGCGMPMLMLMDWFSVLLTSRALRLGYR